MPIVSITILNWETYQPRKDRKKHSWFRVDNTIAFSKSLHGLSPDQRWFFVCLLAAASKEGSESVAFDQKYFSATSKVSARKMIQALELLQEKGVVMLHTDTGRLPPDTLQTNKQTNKQTDTPTASAAFDFEKIYEGYPRHEGKEEGMARLRSRIKTQDEFDRFARAVKEYSRTCRVEGRDARYLLKWSTFVGAEGEQRWLDFDKSNASFPVGAPNVVASNGAHAVSQTEPTVKPSELPAETRAALELVRGRRASGESL